LKMRNKMSKRSNIELAHDLQIALYDYLLLGCVSDCPELDRLEKIIKTLVKRLESENLVIA